MDERSSDVNYSEMKAELQALRKKLEDLETRQAALKSSTPPTVRRRFPKRLIMASISLAALVVAGGLLWGQGAIQALFIDKNGNVGIGTPTPKAALDVAASGGIRISQTAKESHTNELYFADNGQIRSLDDSHRIIFDRSENQLELREFGQIVFSAGGASNSVVIGKDGNVQIAGNVGIGTTTPTAGKRLDVVGDARVSRSLTAENVFAGAPFRIGAGRTTPGKTAWQPYGDRGILVDVDTTAAGFTQTPIYFTSLGGTFNHFIMIGATSIYNATDKGFRIYLKNVDNSLLSPANANADGSAWYIQWMGVQESLGSSK